MKKLTKINLLNLSQTEMKARESSYLRGGQLACYCNGSAVCPCAYAGEQTGPNDHYYGGSSIVDNSYSNFDKQVTDVAHRNVSGGLL